MLYTVHLNMRLDQEDSVTFSATDKGDKLVAYAKADDGTNQHIDSLA